jgi:hypothetical protein
MFAEKLNNYLENRQGEKNLADDEADEISKDLLKAWK